MFTGIVKELGIIKNVARRGSAYRLEIISKDISTSAGIGDSISVNGACLTVAVKKGSTLLFDVMEETARRCNLTAMRMGSRVNLEDSLRANGKLGGHFVLGHVDCIGMIKEMARRDDEVVLRIGYPGDFSGLVVEKGSIALDGVSLTVARLEPDGFSVYLAPYTLNATTLGSKKAGEGVNIEFDIIGKYIRKKVGLGKGPGITEAFLKENGFER